MLAAFVVIRGSQDLWPLRFVVGRPRVLAQAAQWQKWQPTTRSAWSQGDPGWSL